MRPQCWSLRASNLPNGLGKYSGVLLVIREQLIGHAKNGGRIEESLGSGAQDGEGEVRSAFRAASNAVFRASPVFELA